MRYFDPKQEDEFSKFFESVIRKGLEGLVIKDKKSTYDPAQRHWNKIKKDYLEGMADSADLLVLGANYGTGKMGGLMSVFIMGVYDEATKKFKTVCRVGNGHDESTIHKLQDELKMVKISGDYSKVPSWLEIDRSFVKTKIFKKLY